MKNFAFNINQAGIPKIEIPIRLNSLTKEVIEHFLPYCISQIKENGKKIKYLKDFVNGTHQDIDDKRFKFKTSGKANYRLKENHAYEITQFKEGFRVGNKRQLVNKEGVNSDEVSILELMLADADYSSKLMEWVHDLYATGVGITFTMPRQDIFVERKNRLVEYKTTEEGYDVNVNAPFVYETLDGENNAVVYSSCIGETGLKDLFCVNISTVYSIDTKSTEEVVTVYTREKIYEYRKINGLNELIEIGDNSAFGQLPMTEHSANKARISPIEIVYDLLNAINTLLSNEINSVEDKVNQLLVFLNTDLEQESIDNLYKEGILVLPPTGFNTPDIKAITNDLKYTETNILMERILTRMFDIVGVPLASSNVSSGNNEAAYLGGGWTNASAIMNRDIAYSERSEREELRKFLAICKLNPQNPVNEIQASQIEIKYNINQSNNYISKSQAMQNLNDMGIAIEDILKSIPFFGDEEGVAKRCRENREKQKQEEREQEQSNVSTDSLTGDFLKGKQKAQNAQITTAIQQGN